VLTWLQKNKKVTMLAMLAAGAAGALATLYFSDLEMEGVRVWIEALIDEIRTWPAVLFFLMVALLPLIGFPISPLFIIAGVRFGVTWAIPFSMAALAVNLVLAYWFSTRLLHRVIEKIVNMWDYSIPKASPENAFKWVFLVRISGAPLAVQNYILGLAHVPFWPYLLVSMAVQSFFVVGIILFGESFLSGEMGKALLGLAIIVIALGAFSYFRKHYAESKSGPIDTSGPGD
tara:strand:+ start:99 stop:791 length:693 start_codon:yes stop_codon:yes gene_type:complete